MADERYPNGNILQIPNLEPRRHYESAGIKDSNGYTIPKTTPNDVLETLDDLDRVYSMASLLPPELGDIIRDITHVLSIDTQGKLILKIKEEKENPDHDKTPGDNNEETTDKNLIITSNDLDRDKVVDIFSTKPLFSINVDSAISLVDLAHAAYEKDDMDIKQYYTAEMGQISARFYQVMSTIAMEAGMPDYSYLMRDFDGTAVTTIDPNQQHLIDNICKNQILYDQKLRQMNMTHTAEKTLIMTRGMTAAEGQRERYLGEKYKQNMTNTVSAMSNDLLLKSREEAEKKYKDSTYNMYKYLDSATKYTNTLLNLKIDDASAKAQLANTGSDIYAQTPPPQPTATNVDDGFETTKKATQIGQKYIDEQKKDSITGREASAGGSGGSGGGSSYTGPLGGGNVEPEVIFKWLKGKGYSTIAACAILGSIQQESGFNTGATNPSSGAYGLCQWLGDRKDDGNGYGLIPFAQSRNSDPGDAGVQMDWFWEELQNNKSFYDESQPESLNQCTDIQSAAMQFYNNFERGGASQIDGRIGYAEQFYEKFQGQ